MTGQPHRYPVLIKEVDLDFYAHVNNRTYLTLFEEARWDFIHGHGYGFKKIEESRLGPIVLETTIKYLKELKLRDQIVIETSFISHNRMVSKLLQKILRGEEVCCVAEFTIGFFNLETRKLVEPNAEWLRVLGKE